MPVVPMPSVPLPFADFKPDAKGTLGSKANLKGAKKADILPPMENWQVPMPNIPGMPMPVVQVPVPVDVPMPVIPMPEVPEPLVESADGRAILQPEMILP